MLDKNIFNDWKVFNNKIDSFKIKINERIQKIYNKIFELIEAKNKPVICYLYNGRDDNGRDDNCCYECGMSYDENYSDLDMFCSELVRVRWESYYTGKSIYFIDKDDNVIDLSISFPQRWLLDSFEEELVSGLKKFKDKMEAKKLKSLETKAKNKEDKLKLKELIKSKLSIEELELISFKKR